MYTTLPRPTIFAHRGASAHAPENTLAAFHLAVDLGAPAIELDAKLSKDGVVVVHHDQTVDRTTDGSGYVNKLPLAALREFDAGIKFSPKFKGEKIPTLSEVFETVGRKIFINVEITNYTTPLDLLPKKVAELVKLHNLQEYVMFSSFQPLSIRRAHRILPDVPLGLLASSGAKGRNARGIIDKPTPYQALHPDASDVTRKLIDNAHTVGKRVHAYTVNDTDYMERFFSWGIDGIFTDDPALAMQVIADRYGINS